MRSFHALLSCCTFAGVLFGDFARLAKADNLRRALQEEDPTPPTPPTPSPIAPTIPPSTAENATELLAAATPPDVSTNFTVIEPAQGTTGSEIPGGGEVEGNFPLGDFGNYGTNADGGGMYQGGPPEDFFGEFDANGAGDRNNNVGGRGGQAVGRGRGRGPRGRGGGRGARGGARGAGFYDRPGAPDTLEGFNRGRDGFGGGGNFGVGRANTGRGRGTENFNRNPTLGRPDFGNGGGGGNFYYSPENRARFPERDFGGGGRGPSGGFGDRGRTTGRGGSGRRGNRLDAQPTFNRRDDYTRGDTFNFDVGTQPYP